jgi:hypothetical protein
MTNRKYILQKKPVYEYGDPRSSKNSKQAEEKRKRARKLASKLLGKNYFTNMQSIMLKTVMEMTERNKK